MSEHTYKIGDLVRLVKTRGHVEARLDGRPVTIRSLFPTDKFGCDITVDDGDPANPSAQTNGARFMSVLPLRAIAPLEAPAKEAAKMRREAARLLAMAGALEVTRG